MNINEFREGDIIMRNEGVMMPGVSMSLFSLTPSEVRVDTSWVGDKMEFVGVENGKIMLIQLKHGAEILELDEARGYSDGWTYYPTKLFNKAKDALKKHVEKVV